MALICASLLATAASSGWEMSATTLERLTDATDAALTALPILADASDALFSATTEALT